MGGNVGGRLLPPDGGDTMLTQCLAGTAGACLSWVNLAAGCLKPTVSTDSGVRPCPLSKCIFMLGDKHLRVPRWLPRLSRAGMENKAGNRVADEQNQIPVTLGRPGPAKHSPLIPRGIHWAMSSRITSASLDSRKTWHQGRLQNGRDLPQSEWPHSHQHRRH